MSTDGYEAIYGTIELQFNRCLNPTNVRHGTKNRSRAVSSSFEHLDRSYSERSMGGESHHSAASFLHSPPRKAIMKDLLKLVGVALIMWMIISAGMIEIAGKAGILLGAVITGIVFLSVYIYYREKQ